MGNSQYYGTDRQFNSHSGLLAFMFSVATIATKIGMIRVTQALPENKKIV